MKIFFKVTSVILMVMAISVLAQNKVFCQNQSAFFSESIPGDHLSEIVINNEIYQGYIQLFGQLASMGGAGTTYEFFWNGSQSTIILYSEVKLLENFTITVTSQYVSYVNGVAYLGVYITDNDTGQSSGTFTLRGYLPN
jgi:hypothetical protein